ncbi:unnamed protein product [Brugia timori]|uniref:Uncharacterized protein n=1 Tax=Brugia timori TaxID=42155 RepID=A0A3P7U1M6_9BILA|nr:unnamed protein product [Brugia timori]
MVGSCRIILSITLVLSLAIEYTRAENSIVSPISDASFTLSASSSIFLEFHFKSIFRMEAVNFRIT